MFSRKIKNSMFGLIWGLHLVLAQASSAETLQITADLEREAKLFEFYEESIQPVIQSAINGRFTALPNHGEPMSLRFRALLPQRAKAGIVIVSGFGERIGSYQELAYDFYQQGYNVYLYDHRGQGSSNRLQSNNRAIHVDNFSDYVEDLRLFLNEVVLPSQGDKELFVFAHSMGGAITSRFLLEYPGFFKAAILSSPMHQMALGNFSPWIAKTIAVIADTLGFGRSYAIGQSGPKPWPFESAATHSRARWQLYQDYYEHNVPNAELTGGATYRWVRAALKATHDLLKDDKLKTLATPVLLLQAGIEKWVEAPGQDQFCAIAPACTLIRYDQAKHEIYRESDAIRTSYLRDIFSFLDSHQSQRLSTKTK